MTTLSFPDISRHETEQVRQFFNQWEIYRKVVAADYLHHRGAYAAIGEVIAGMAQPFSFLDLGAGDASATAAVLKGSRLQHYEAVDISGVALNLAEKNSAAIPCEKKFIHGDFFQHVKERAEFSGLRRWVLSPAG